LPSYRATPAPQLSFTEEMAGFVSTLASGSYDASPASMERFEAGRALGRDDGSGIRFVLTILIEDLPAMLADPATKARVRGIVIAPDVAPGNLEVTHGTFQLLVRDPTRVETWNMIYDLDLAAEDGRAFRFHGFKVLHQRPGLKAWRDTTTLFVSVTGDDPATDRFGIMRLTVGDLVRQVSTMEVLNVSGRYRRFAYLWAFLKRFAYCLLRIYGGALDEAGRFPPLPPTALSVSPPVRRPSRLPRPETHWLDRDGMWQKDGRVDTDARLCLTRYRHEDGSKGSVMLAPGFGMAASSFLVTTIEPNVVEYLYGEAYDVWLFDYRASINLPQAARGPFTLDDIAREDWPEAVAEVRRLTDNLPVKVVAHCVGSVTLLMALLHGMKGVRSAVCSQFTTQPKTSWFNLLKARLRVSRVLQLFGIRVVQPLQVRRWSNYVLDIALRAAPMAREERCGQAVCRWINAVYGCTHRHAQLDDDTHKSLTTQFGVGDLDAFNHIALIMREGRALDHLGYDAYLPYPGRLADVPIHFLIGDRNYIFFPQGNDRTIRWLKANNPHASYSATELHGYAHLDCFIGKDAPNAVFPKILEFLNRT
jgi:cholesterol oxidase